jgi:hypothetical protein
MANIFRKSMQAVKLAALLLAASFCFSATARATPPAMPDDDVKTLMQMPPDEDGFADAVSADTDAAASSTDDSAEDARVTPPGYQPEQQPGFAPSAADAATPAAPEKK